MFCPNSSNGTSGLEPVRVKKPHWSLSRFMNGQESAIHHKEELIVLSMIPTRQQTANNSNECEPKVEHHCVVTEC